MVLGIPSDKGEYLRWEQFSVAIRKSKELDVKVEVYLIDQPRKMSGSYSFGSLIVARISPS